MATKERIRNMTTGSPLKLLVTFAIPMMLGNVLQLLYTVVDTAIVGQALGVQALASLGAADWLNFSIIGSAQGFAQGFSIYMAQRFGADDYEGLNRSIGVSITLSIGITATLMLTGYLGLEPLLRFLNTPEETIGGALLYLYIFVTGLPVIMTCSLLFSILRTLGDSRTPLVAMVVSSLLNIGLDLLFVMVFQFGIAGAAVATLIAQALAGVYAYRAVRRIRFLQLKKEDLRPDPTLAKRLFGLGLPIAGQNLVITIGGLAVQSVVNSYGMLFVAGITATNKLFGMLDMAAISFGAALTTFVGQNKGAGKLQRIRKGTHVAAGVSLVISAVVSVTVYLLAEVLIRLFISGTPEEMAVSLSVGTRYLRLMACGLFVLYMLYIYRSALMGLGDTVIPMISGVVELAMRFLVVFTLPPIIGEYGIYSAEVAAWIGAAILLVIAYYGRMRRLPHTEQPAP